MVCWMYLWFESMKEMAMRSQSWLCSLPAWLHIVILLDMEFYTCFFRRSMQCVAGLLFVVLDLFIFGTYVVLKYWLDGSRVQFVNSWAGWLMMKQLPQALYSTDTSDGKLCYNSFCGFQSETADQEFSFFLFCSIFSSSSHVKMETLTGRWHLDLSFSFLLV